jgi:hypothetical protein
MIEPSEPFYVILKPLSWPYSNEIPNLLGRIVKNFYSPFDQCAPDAPGQYCERKLIVHGPLKDFKLSVEGHHERSAQGQADNIAQVSKKFADSVTTQLAGKNLWAVRLQQFDDVFETITTNSSVQEKLFQLLRRFSSNEAYFIAGLLIAEDVSISLESSSSNSASIDIRAPISTMAQLAAQSPITIPIGNVSASGNRSDSLVGSLQGRVEGRRIVAIDCRVVRRLWFVKQVVLTEQNPRSIPPARKFAGGDDELVLGGILDKGKLDELETDESTDSQ